DAKAARRRAEAEKRAAERKAAERTAVARQAAQEREARAARGTGAGTARSAEESANEITVPTPVVKPDRPVEESANEITVPTPIVRLGAQDDETAVLPRIKDRDARAADETAVLPVVRDTETTAALPRVRDDRPSDPADRVPPGIFRDERTDPHGANERTRELPQLDENGRPRRRSDWAEETPLDDLPTLADELFGGYGEDDGEAGPGSGSGSGFGSGDEPTDDENRRGNRRRRR
ncbi:hypothetical protein BU197_04380, partial [Streptomyces sp. CBMA291]|nr:hypothetical protein [Streptomyces sp. CBMA291]